MTTVTPRTGRPDQQGDAGLVRAIGVRETVAVVREPSGRVYFVGGNEVQQRYEEWLRAEAARRWPKVALEFDFTGWSGNWGRELGAIEEKQARGGAAELPGHRQGVPGPGARPRAGAGTGRSGDAGARARRTA